jgi:hypothetical protein
MIRRPRFSVATVAIFWDFFGIFLGLEMRPAPTISSWLLGSRNWNPQITMRTVYLPFDEGNGMRTALAALIGFALMWGTAVADEVRILGSPGGEVGPFLDMFQQLRESGDRVVIDGPCLSACTLVLSVVPNNRICVTKRAVLGFHAARSIDRRGRLYAEPEATDRMLNSYPTPVRTWIRRRGGLTSRLLLLRGRELAGFLPVCR